ncbi:hypothetical protein [Desulfosediminicola flagellatus]|uniref:hypothetical protein n=1 Tax=Desulfosediminicola flagellatus TaxID=2569541 RepID=UPI00113D441D|nr:hypothetical protein [Desulfosediminicola flagellatus]
MASFCVLFLATCNTSQAIEIAGKKYTLLQYEEDNTYVLVKGRFADGGPLCSYDDMLRVGLIDVPPETTRFHSRTIDKESALIAHIESGRDIHYVYYSKSDDFMNRGHERGTIRGGIRDYSIGEHNVVDGKQRAKRKKHFFALF